MHGHAGMRACASGSQYQQHRSASAAATAATAASATKSTAALQPIPRRLHSIPHQHARLTSSCRAQAAAAAAPTAPDQPVAVVGWQAAGASISVSVRCGSDGPQQLLRLQEQSCDSEYVLLLPASVSGVLLEALQRAVQCVETANDGRPLELHHTVLLGSRTFRCSLLYSPATDAAASSNGSSEAARRQQQQQLVTVTVQELGRSCVHLPVSTAVLQPVRQLIEQLQADALNPQPQPPAQPGSLAGAGNSTSPQAADAAATDAAQLSSSSTTTTSTTTSPAAPAAAGTASPSKTPAAAPEVLFAAISGSSSLKDGLRFAHAAAAEAWGGTGDDANSNAFQLPHLCALWQRLPAFAASLQREVLQLGPDDVPDAEVLLTAGAALYPEAQQELQGLVQVLVPLLQPQLHALPRHMLQRLLKSSSVASVQLPDSFLAAWAAAAAAARGSWETEGPAALLEVTELLLQVQDSEALSGRGPVVLPLQWCATALAEVSQQLQQAAPQLYSGQAAQADEQEQVLATMREQLVPVLLAAAGHQLRQQQLLWQPWAQQDHSPSSSSSGASTAASITQSLQMLLAAEPPGSTQHSQLQDFERALIPGMQQSVVMECVAGLPAQQQAAAVALVWSWLARGGGARTIDTALLLRLLEQLPYDSTAAEYAAGGSGNGSSRSSLLQCVLEAHAGRSNTAVSSSVAGQDSAEVQQLEAVSGLLGFCLQADVRTAFAALPAMLQMLPVPGSSSNSSSSQRWQAAVAELSGRLQHMLHSLGPQQLLQQGPAVLQALARLSTARHATPQCVLTALQMAQELADAADSWHAAELQPEAVMEPVATARQLVVCCAQCAPAFADVFERQAQQEQQNQQMLPVLAEVLTAAAALHEQHAETTSLAPAWLQQQDSQQRASNSSCPWDGFAAVVLAAAEEGSDSALDAADVAAATSALLVLGVHPSEQLLQLYWGAVGPEAISLNAVGLQQLLLWISAALLASGSGSGSSAPQLLQLASKACSSLAVRSVSALSARQAAKVTWALAQLSGSKAAAAAGWSPPQQMVTWLQRVWQGMDGATGASSSSAGTGDGDLQHKVDQLLMHNVLHQQEAAQLLSSLQHLKLCPSKQPAQQQQQQHEERQEQPDAAEHQQPPPLPPAQQQREHHEEGVAAAQQAPVHPLLQQQQLLRERLAAAGGQPSTGSLRLHTLDTTKPAAAAAGSAVSDFLASRRVQPLQQQQQKQQQRSAGVAATAAEAASGAPPTAKQAVSPAAADSSSQSAAAAEPAAVAAAAPATPAAATPAAAEAAPAAATMPPSVASVLQQLQDPAGSTGLTQKTARQLLLPVQQHIDALTAADLRVYLEACFAHKVPLSAHSWLAAGHAVAASQAAAAGADGQEALLPTPLVLQLLSAMAASVDRTGAGTDASSSAGSAAASAGQSLRQLLTALPAERLATVSAADLLQLLRDVFTLSTGHRPPKAAALPVGTTLFGTQQRSPAGSSDMLGLPEAWLAAVAGALQPKLLLLPHGSHLLQSMQLLQALGCQQPSSTFMASFLAAADALLDTLSGRGCLELLAATAAAGQLPSKPLTAALLQHLVPLRLPAADVAAGSRLLASLGIRPSAELLLQWFDATEAAAEQLTPPQVLQVLWACCVWQLQPPTTWLNAVIRGLLPAGRLSSSSPATLAGICRCLWQLGVQPAPGFVAAVTAAAEHSLQGKQQGLEQDVESLSVLCHCLLMWQHAGTPSWQAVVAERAAELMPRADGPALLRLSLYLSYLQQDQQQQEQGAEEGDDEMLPWQQALLQTVPDLLPSAAAAAGGGSGGQEVVMTADSAAEAVLRRQIPAWALVVLSYVLATVPEQSLPVLRRLAAAVEGGADAEQLSCWDVISLLPGHLELLQVLEQLAEDAVGPLAAVKLRQLQQESDSVRAAAGELLKHAYQQRDGAPADVLATLPALASAFGIEMPKQSRVNLEAAEAAAREREQQLQQALMLQAQGGPAVPETLLQGLAELAAHDAPDMVADYAAAPLQAAFQRRLYWLGAAVGDEWVLRGLASG